MPKNNGARRQAWRKARADEAKKAWDAFDGSAEARFFFAIYGMHDAYAMFMRNRPARPDTQETHND